MAFIDELRAAFGNSWHTQSDLIVQLLADAIGSAGGGGSFPFQTLVGTGSPQDFDPVNFSKRDN